MLEDCRSKRESNVNAGAQQHALRQVRLKPHAAAAGHTKTNYSAPLEAATLVLNLA